MVNTPGVIEAPIVFFDGVCGLCNGFVDFAMKHDRGERLRFATLQGETASRVLGAGRQWRDGGVETGKESSTNDDDWMKSIVFWNGRAYRKSDAVLRIFPLFGGAWKGVRALYWIPPVIRDTVYDWIARNRYKWFGKRVSCRTPGPHERARFLP